MQTPAGASPARRRPSSARDSSARPRVQVALRPPSARRARETASSSARRRQQHLRIPPHPPAEPPSAPVSSALGDRPGSAPGRSYRSRFEYDRAMREHRAAAAAAQAPPPSVAAASSGPGSEPLGRGGSADYGPNKIGEVSGRHIEEEEPVGSFRRRFDAQARLMDGLTKSRHPGKAQPASGVQWGQLKSGLAALFESRSRASRGGRSRKGIAQYRISAAAQMPGPRQKALERRIGDLNDHYELGSAARILNQVDRTFVKRQRCPACHSCGECRPGCSLKGRGGARNNPFAPQLDEFLKGCDAVATADFTSSDFSGPESRLPIKPDFSGRQQPKRGNRTQKASSMKVTREWVEDLERARRDLAPWTTAQEAKRTWETSDERRARLRNEMIKQRQEKESKKLHGEGWDGDNGGLVLRSVEHASLSLQLALQREAAETMKQEKQEKKKMSADIVAGLGGGADTVKAEGRGGVTACIRALNELAQSNYIENQRDVAAALYSLSINEENKPAFIEANSLSTLIKMAEAKDPDIRRKVAGSMYHLSMSRKVKRPFVKLGALKPLLAFSVSKDSEIQRYSMYAIKELCENPANRTDIIDADALPCLYDHCSASDSRVRGMAIWTLTALAEDQEHRLRMVECGGLQRMLTVLRSSDTSMRRGAADCLVKLSKLLEISPKVAKELTSQSTLSVLITALKDTDLDVVLSICKTLQSLKSSKVQKLMLQLDGLAHLLGHALRLLNMEGTSEIITNLTQTVNTLYAFMPVKYPKNVMVIHDKGHMGTILQLCKHSHQKVRRSAGKLLARLSTIDEAKDKMMGESETVNLLISMCKHRDSQCQLTAVKVIAELAEEPRNRVPLVMAATLPALFQLMRIADRRGDDTISFQCARATADLAEAVDNRVAIVYGGLKEILTLMLSDDDHVQEQGMRCLVNLAGPAGFACGSESNEVGRFGGLNAMRVDDDLDHEEEESEDSSDFSSSEDEFDDVDDVNTHDGDDDSDSMPEEHEMDAIASLIDENLADTDGLDGVQSDSQKQSTITIVPEILASNTAIGMTAVALSMATSEDHEEEIVLTQPPQSAASQASTAQASPSKTESDVDARRSAVLERAKLLVRKAAMAEQNRVAVIADEEERRLPGAGERSETTSGDSKPRDSKSPDVGVKKRKERRGSALGLPRDGPGSRAAESGFSRYRRQSSLADKATGKKPKIRGRRLSVGWTDMAGLLSTGPRAGIEEQSHEWWSSPEGEKLVKTYNTLTIDRIHLKIAESQVIKRLLELVFDETPHVSEYAEMVIQFIVERGKTKR